MVRMIDNVKLTLREQNVVILLIQGYTNRQISAKLYISVSTVKTYIEKIYAKFNVHNRIELILYVLKNKIITLEDINSVSE